MLKVLFINPQYYIHHPPLGLGYLSSYLKKFFHEPIEVRLFDEVAGDRDLPSMIRTYRPDLIGITVVTPTFNRTKDLCSQIRGISDVPIVVGGPHITALPESILHTDIDVGVIGEGELTFLEIVECLHQTGQIKNPKIHGIAYTQDGGLIQTHRRHLIADLDSVPIPDRGLFNMRYYVQPKKMANGLYAKGTSMMPSRGCPFGNCNFCSSSLIWGTVPRLFSPNVVVNEIERIVTEYDTNFVIFLDDNFTTYPAWLESLSLLLKERGLHKILYFDCESIAAFINDKRAALLKEMGCVRIEFGFESGCERILNILKSGKSKIKHHERAIEICKQHEIAILGNIIMGYVTETPEEIEESVQWFLNQPIDFIAPQLYTPYPGTSGWDECVTQGIIKPAELTQWEEFATGCAEHNIVVNVMSPENQLLNRFNEVKAELALRNKALVIDAGLSFQEKLHLYQHIEEDKIISGFRKIDYLGPKARKLKSKICHQSVKIYRQFGKIRKFIWSDKKIWRLRNKFLPKMPLLCRLPFGAWWLAWYDDIGIRVYQKEDFEQEEQAFLLRFLDSGMSILDIGAHQGFYTLLFSKKVGRHGRVIAFEPSPCERQRLQRTLALNRCQNVHIEPIALSDTEGTATLFVCFDPQSERSSLRFPAVLRSNVEKIQVSMTTIDHYFENSDLDKVDLIKVDAEGAELAILQGAQKLLNHDNPIILCKLDDGKTKPWKYPSVEIYNFLRDYKYFWFFITSDGQLCPCSVTAQYHGKLLAVPEKRLPEIKAYVLEDKSADI